MLAEKRTAGAIGANDMAQAARFCSDHEITMPEDGIRAESVLKS